MNKNIFKSAATQVAPANTVNEAGGKAYKLSNEEALAQLVATGCFNNTFYSNGAAMLDQVISLAKTVDVTFLAKLTIYARKQAFMKDSPAVLLAVLSARHPWSFRLVAPLVLDNMKMVRNFVEVIRSGKVGRKSLGSEPRKAIQRVFNKMTDEQLFLQSIGKSPSIQDVIKLAHVPARTPSRDQLFKYLLGFPVDKYNLKLLPQVVQDFEAFKKDQTLPVPAVDFQMLSALNLTDQHWTDIGKKMNWHTLRMNLNTLARHNCMSDQTLVQSVCAKIADRQTIQKVKVFPYQLFATYLNTASNTDIPRNIKDAVQDALDISVENVPKLNVDKLFICLDVSGSMGSPVTGNRGTATTNVRCADVAAIFAASFVKSNTQIPDIQVIAFDTSARSMGFNTRDSLATIAQNINLPGGGTDCSIAMKFIMDNGKIKKSDNIAVVYVSDNESWADFNNSGYRPYYRTSSGTGTAELWNTVKRSAKTAKMVLIDIQPSTSTQAQTDKDVLNVGGFSDAVFDVVSKFINTQMNWADIIQQIRLPTNPVEGIKTVRLEKSQETDYWQDAD